MTGSVGCGGGTVKVGRGWVAGRPECYAGWGADAEWSGKGAVAVRAWAQRRYMERAS